MFRTIWGSTAYCITLVELSHLSVPYFSHVQNEGDNGTFIIGLLYEMW